MLTKKLILGIGLASLTATASAHVSISNVSSNTAGSHSEVRFRVPHGCGEKATLKIIVETPADVSVLAP